MEKSYALHNIDVELARIIGKRNGFFIEAGANDGQTQSNTLLLEEEYGWNGILIEPILDLYLNCLRRRIAGRNVYINAALVSDENSGKSIQMIYTPACNGLLSVVDDYRAMELMKRTSERGVLVDVAALSLNVILDGLKQSINGLSTPDLLVLDVEGYESEALKGLDLDRHPIEYLLVEELSPNGIQQMLEPRYEMIRKFGEHDYLYKRLYDR